ncbi:AmmeMemoRadiSam system protein A [Patescibacteria group bacterium]|nr:AmmeMemoRadiSam system protein A [Patescibacteria group bacterium]
MFTTNDKKYILDLARRSIEYYFGNKSLMQMEENELSSPELVEERSCFVTLTIDDDLRGCIGHVEAIQPLYLDIIENAVAAAFNDQRFRPLSEKEFALTEIEVSVLTKPKKLDFSSSEDLLKKLRPGIDGVVLRLGNYGATYLPQVWEDFADKESFLNSLCLKAGLNENDWENPDLEIMTYQAEIIK